VNIRDDDSYVKFKRCSFTDNLGQALKCSFRDRAKIILDECSFTLNNGNELFGTSAVSLLTSGESGGTYEIVDCLFEENFGYYSGACIESSFVGQGPDQIIIDRCDFVDNTSSNDGGAISHRGRREGQKMTIRNSLFASNSSGRGGAIYFSGDLSASNSIFDSNNGDAIAVRDVSKLEVVNSTFNDNAIQGESVSVDLGFDCIAEIYNSAFWNGTTDDNFDVKGRSTLLLSHSFLGHFCPSTTNVTCVNSMTGEISPFNNLAGDFNKFMPRENSLLVDVGLNSIGLEKVDYYFARNPQERGYRITNNTIDVGAREFVPRCPNVLSLDPQNVPFSFFGNQLIQGAWAARDEIFLKPGLSTDQINYLILDAPEVNIESDYEFRSGATLEVFREGCIERF